MLPIDLNNQNFIQFAKVIALFFAMFPLLVGFVLIRRVSRMNSILHTKRTIVITFLDFLYIAVLIIVIGLIIVL